MDEVEESSPMDPSTLNQIPSKEAEDSSPVSLIHQNKIPQRRIKRFSLKILSESYEK